MNNSYRDKAIKLLHDTEATFVYVGRDEVITSDLTGIKRLLALADENRNLSEGFAADRIVGKAAAMLMLLCGVQSIYADTLSKPAYDVFSAHGVKVLFRKLVPVIINRRGDGLCPMEKAVLDIDDPEKAYETLLATVRRMSAANAKNA